MLVDVDRDDRVRIQEAVAEHRPLALVDVDRDAPEHGSVHPVRAEAIAAADKARKPVRNAYFPIDCIISVVAVMRRPIGRVHIDPVPLQVTESSVISPQ